MEKNLISISDIIRQGWQIYTDNFNKFIYPILIMLLPYVALFAVQYLQPVPNVLLVIALTALTIIINLWIAILLIELLNGLYHKKNIEPGSLYEKSFKQLPSYFWAVLIAAILIFLGLIVFIIPGIIMAIWYSFAGYINILEKDNNKGYAASKSSKELVRGRWGATLWRLLIPSLFVYIIVSIVIVGLYYALTGGNIDLQALEQSILYNSISTLVIIILSPLFGAFSIILYNELKKTYQPIIK